jgi:hypothetical protein
MILITARAFVQRFLKKRNFDALAGQDRREEKPHP